MLSGRQAQTAHQISNSISSELLPAFGWPVALLVDPVGDLPRGQTLSRQLAHTLAQEAGIVAELLQLIHGPDRDVFRAQAARPADLCLDPLARSFHVDHDPL